ncbi:methionine ABC transporter ATP-binding protein [Brevibacterium luteolum]|uniref:methionine ABC transporter ATP-binding protein n=1 Tax=Brevibacterium luteolum TaxID=199591 RepID=UPI0021B03CB1|nr:ATP-binding cassette domain-containing protein [Brevibacterium luteolum]MCT1874387.1 ATP-binding cassette domain-containing protein [Brevibacterium luteolum]MCT1891589.1 ATP-binding cassette domain-containing protein [Brevibacterium luteolum]MCT1894048.1 ATP-binding cassette domain-containing protein [Brevibacterium luteolum]MCT1924545.1 ATP-binding cassette domain-containing protein [Brevibacterium luteolum]
MIELRDLRKEFAGVTALDGITLSVPAGEIHGIVGRSGAGKSTLIRCLTGLERPTSGTVRIGEVEITSARGAALRTARRTIGMVFQDANLLDSRTALRNVEHPLEIAGVPRSERRARAAELLELVGLADRGGSYPAQLSGGQQQRVGIARALAAEPQILLCDEPTSALDSRTTRQILDLIRSLRDRLGITVLIITHEMSVVREVCDSVTLLADGQIENTGSIIDVLSQAGSPLSRALLPLPPSGRPSGTVVETLTTGISLDTALEAVRSSGADAHLDAGTVETIAGTVVGRLQFTVADAAGAQTLITSLAARDIHAEVA